MMTNPPAARGIKITRKKKYHTYIQNVDTKLGEKKLDCLFEIVYLKLTDLLRTHVGEIISKQKNEDDKMETKHDFLG
jgi:hypothetical protein